MTCGKGKPFFFIEQINSKLAIFARKLYKTFVLI